MNVSTPDYALEFSNGEKQFFGSAQPAFVIAARDPGCFADFLRKDPYSAALAYLRGEISIRGDLVAAIRFYTAQPHAVLPQWGTTLIARLLHSRPANWLLRWRNAARDIQYHYDQSNEFYRLFLDPWMVYSCAYFPREDESLENAQLAKLEHICRKLQLRAGDRFLDIGCGWGGLARYAASRYDVTVDGFTLSAKQAEYARRAVAEDGLPGKVSIVERSYENAQGTYQKIASVGMFEHLGSGRLEEYFRKIYALLAEDGLFLNHGIVRPEPVSVGAETLFLDRHVFPGSGLVPLSELIRVAGKVGFEVLDVENLRPHYALTCRHWVQRLQAQEEQSLQLVSRETYRTWLLYLAASAANFEAGYTEVHQVLFAKRGSAARNWLTRDFLYANSSTGPVH